LAAAAGAAGLGGGGAARGGGGGAGRAIWGAGRGGGGAGRGGGGAGLAICGAGRGGGSTRRISGFGGMGFEAATAGLGGRGGGGVTGFLIDSGTSGFAPGAFAEAPPFGSLVGDVWVPDDFGLPETAGTFGAKAVGGVVPGASFAFGFGVPGAGPVAPGGTGGAPLVPGTGRALVFGSVLGDMLVGNGLFGPAGTPGVPGFTAGLIEALGGTGSFPCWISVALCATEGGRAAVAAVGVGPPGPGAPFAAPACGAPVPGATGPGWGG
jgi:hypothetical protein